MSDSSKRSFRTQLRYAVSLFSDDLDASVLLVDRFYWIEVYFNGQKENCFQVRKVICEAISTCSSILAYDQEALNAEVTVFCEQEHTINDHKFHPAILSIENNLVNARCSIEKDLPMIELANERKTCWLIGELHC